MEGGGWLSVVMILGVMALGVALGLIAQRWRHRRKDPWRKARNEM